MTAHVSRTTIQALNTAPLRRKFHRRIAGPSVRFRNTAIGKTPANVATAIFHCGGGFGERNHRLRVVQRLMRPRPGFGQRRDFSPPTP